MAKCTVICRRAAVWWDDLDPSAYGQVSYESVTSVLPPTSTFTVTWAGVNRASRQNAKSAGIPKVNRSRWLLSASAS